MIDTQVFAAATTNAAVIERATLHPWVVAVGYQFQQGTSHLILQIVERRMDDRPDALGWLPVGAELTRAEVYPAARFDDMPPATRSRWMPHYRAYLMWRKAKSLGKKPYDMQPWEEYDPVAIDEAVQRWGNPGVRFTGE